MAFEERFFLNRFGDAFPRSQDIVDELTDDKMFTTPGPLPEREAELDWLNDALDIPGSGLI